MQYLYVYVYICLVHIQLLLKLFAISACSRSSGGILVSQTLGRHLDRAAQPAVGPMCVRLGLSGARVISTWVVVSTAGEHEVTGKNV